MDIKYRNRRVKISNLDLLKNELGFAHDGEYNGRCLFFPCKRGGHVNLPKMHDYMNYKNLYTDT